MTRVLIIIGVVAIMPFAVGCDSTSNTGGSGGDAGSGGTAGSGGDAGSGGAGGSGGVNVLPDGVVCDGTNTPCEMSCATTNCVQECDGNLNTGGTIQVVCSASCPGGGCNQQCEDGATCTFTCEGGTCAQSCDVADESTCDFSCTPGDCT